MPESKHALRFFRLHFWLPQAIPSVFAFARGQHHNGGPLRSAAVGTGQQVLPRRRANNKRKGQTRREGVNPEGKCRRSAEGATVKAKSPKGIVLLCGVAGSFRWPKAAG
uniref:Uncharacterized protein n=1 Tax=Caulerpa lentillifera TaxID=148947 RepID=A0A2Z2QKQ4_9CHLO|nr:hypothetical protein [Caulerpa lentillifera]AST24259.1 hypothetical protein [Caulerpa lentillifera]QKS32243.1 hypothetical protein [Caulerpa lentillifera]